MGEWVRSSCASPTNVWLVVVCCGWFACSLVAGGRLIRWPVVHVHYARARSLVHRSRAGVLVPDMPTASSRAGNRRVSMHPPTHTRSRPVHHVHHVHHVPMSTMSTMSTLIHFCPFLSTMSSAVAQSLPLCHSLRISQGVQSAATPICVRHPMVL